MSNRWKMNRIGFVNFWLYDEEIFSFSDGKLLLRGANASGKSITTQSFIPFILDGDRTPSRLDPFGSSDRKMEYYFLGNAEKEDVTGYLFLEFKKENTERYITIGIGQRAQKGKPMDFWGFIILDGRRIGFNIDLYKEVGSKKIPYTKQDLKKELNEDNVFVEKQKDYMEMVNKYVFGFPRIQQFEQFIRLMIKVRAPKLSRDFKPTKVYEILNESLQALSDEDLRAMVDAMEKMDDIQNKLDALKVVFKDVQSIRTEYNHYNRYMLSKKAEAYLSLKKQVEKGRKKLEAYRDEVKDKTDQIDCKKDENDNSHIEIEILEKERGILSDENLESYFDKLKGSKKQKTSFEEDIKEQSLRIEASRQKIREHDSDYRHYKMDIGNYQQEIDNILQELESINDTLQFAEHKSVGEAIRQRSLKSPLSGINNGLKELASLISKGLQMLQELKKIEEEWNKVEEELSELNINKSNCDEQFKIAEEIETKCRDELVESFYILADKYQELVIGKQDLTCIVSLVMKYGGAKDIGEINKIIDMIKVGRERILLDNNGMYKTKRENIYDRHKKSKQELDELRNQKEPLPERSTKVVKSREILAEKGIGFLPLYEALEFNKLLSEEEQSLIEEQLSDAGLLDALIVAPKDYERAKIELSSLSDSLIRVDSNVNTGYNKLIPSRVNMELRDVVKEVISNIYDHDGEGADIVLASDGYYKNGVIEGYSVSEGQASFVGVIARRNKLNRMIADKEDECSELEEQLKECDELISSIQKSINTLDSEYKAIPSFIDLDQAIGLVKDADYDLKKASEECQKKEKELSKILGCKKECEQKVIVNCKVLPYDRTLAAYEEADEDLKNYKEDLTDLEKALNYFDMAQIKCQSISALIDKEEEIIDTADEQSRRSQQGIQVCESEIEQIEEFLNRPENKEKAERLKEIKIKLDEKNNKIVSNREAIARLAENIKTTNETIVSLNEDVISGVEKENKVRSYFKEELELKYVIEQGNKTLFESANEALACTRESDKNKSVSEAVASLHKVYQKNNSNLTSYGTFLQDCFEDDISDYNVLRKRQRIVSTWQGRKVELEEFYRILKESIDSTELLIQEKDRILFEDILADTLSRKLSNRIAESKNWIIDMSKLMQDMDTSMGLTFSLDWKPRIAEGENELDTKELEKLLSRDRELLMHEDIEKLSSHFRSKIRIAKQTAEDNGDIVNYADMVREALDFRKWFEFRMYFYTNGQPRKELTNSAFNKFSGGEKAMAMYVPLFAAVNAQYKKSDDPNHPRIIALDEAFAGVDDKNISTMFNLVQKLDFDYIMNSQALWGCYETVKSLRIAELLRPANSDVVTVIYYYWNGKERILDEQ